MTSTLLGSLPLAVRWAVVGAVAAGLVGAIAGLVVGLTVYAPTAWFAVFELGVPSALVGGFLGLLCGGAVTAVRRR